MAKIVKKKRKLKLQGVISFVFTISLCGYLASAFLLRSANVYKNIELSELKAANIDSQKELETLRLEVSKYTERDYLMSICRENGIELDYNTDRITYIDNQE